MFLDTEMGMGIWTRHVTDDGRVFYFNMKRNQSKWEYEFADSTSTQSTIEFLNQKAVIHPFLLLML